MLTTEQMRLQAQKYMLCFYEDTQDVYLLKTKGEVKVSHKRALEWVKAGITDLDCKSTERMTELLTTWIKEGSK